MASFNKSLLIIQQTLFYYHQGKYFVMPHIEGTLSLVSNNFSKPTILTIVLQGAPPVGYVSLSTKFKVVHFFKRNEKTNKIILFLKYFSGIPLLFILITKYDVIQLRLPSTPALIAGFINLLLKKPCLPSIHGDISLLLKRRNPHKITYIFFANLLDYLIKSITSNSKLTIVMGKDLLRLVKGNYLLSANYQFTIKDIYYRKDTCSDTIIKLLYVGSIIETKGIDELISCVQNLKTRNYNVKLVLIGPIISEKYKAVFNENKSNNIIEHIGYIPWGQQLFEHYRSSDIFVFPSYSEGNPKAPMEALANSLPVVCTESGCSNYIINEFNGIIVNTADVEDLVIGIIKMMTNNFLRQQCISNGIQTAINNTRETIQFNLSKFIQNYY